MKFELKVRITEEDTSRQEVRRLALFVWDETDVLALVALLTPLIRERFSQDEKLLFGDGFRTFEPGIFVMEGSMLAETEASIWRFELAPWEPIPEVFLAKEDDIRAAILW